MTVSRLGLGKSCLEMSIEVHRFFKKLHHGSKECQDKYLGFVQLMLACPYVSNPQLISSIFQNSNIAIIV